MKVVNPTKGELVDGSDPFYTESLLRLKFLTARVLDRGTAEERI
jgi:hypothetical protein